MKDFEMKGKDGDDRYAENRNEEEQYQDELDWDEDDDWITELIMEEYRQEFERQQRLVMIPNEDVARAANVILKGLSDLVEGDNIETEIVESSYQRGSAYLMVYGDNLKVKNFKKLQRLVEDGVALFIEPYKQKPGISISIMGLEEAL